MFSSPVVNNIDNCSSVYDALRFVGTIRNMMIMERRSRMPLQIVLNSLLDLAIFAIV